jgi:hypothetical protein
MGGAHPQPEPFRSAVSRIRLCRATPAFYHDVSGRLTQKWLLAAIATPAFLRGLSRGLLLPLPGVAAVIRGRNGREDFLICDRRLSAR